MPIYEDKSFKEYVNDLPAVTDVSSTDIVSKDKTSGDVVKADGKPLEAAGLSFFSNTREYLYAIVDSSNRFLFGIKNDGSIDWAIGVPKPINVEKVDKEDGKSLIDEVFANSSSSISNREFLQVVVDSVGKLVEYVDNEGRRVFKTSPRFDSGIDWSTDNLNDLEAALKRNGFSGGQGDWTDKDFLNIQKPHFAIVNITGTDSLPTTKTEDMSAEIEFWDMNGNFFKKKTVLNAQGNSSLQWVKKNIGFDLLNADGGKFSLKIGDWVEQDSFHLKAYYTDFFRGTGAVGYKIFDEIEKSRGLEKNATWKNALVQYEKQSAYSSLGVDNEVPYDLRIDTGAKCYPDGFPVALYLNGTFYGLFAWQLKKHRDNYHMDKDNVAHIHLDGELSANGFFAGNIDWTKFEIRNPKDLYTMQGEKYDGDNPTEIVDSSNAENWIASGVLPNGTTIDAKLAKKLRNTAKVKEYIVGLPTKVAEVKSLRGELQKGALRRYFDVDNLIDYQIFGDILDNLDGFSKNWQWTTWDGNKWFVNPYDLDMIFGASSTGNYVRKPRTSMLAQHNNLPVYYVQTLFADELKARYAFLRSNGVASVENFTKILNEWVKAIGKGFFNLEWEKWPFSPCNNNIQVDAHWEVVFGDDGNPVIADSINYSNTTNYNVGDIATHNASEQAGWAYTFRCVANCVGVSPAKYAFKDSIWRVEKWLEKEFQNMDVVYNYNQGA